MISFFDSEDHVKKSDILLYNPKKRIEFYPENYPSISFINGYH